MANERMNHPTALMRLGFEPWEQKDGIVTSVRLPFPEFQTDEGEEEDEQGNMTPLPGKPVVLKRWDDRVTEVLIDFLEKLDAQQASDQVKRMPATESRSVDRPRYRDAAE